MKRRVKIGLFVLVVGLAVIASLATVPAVRSADMPETDVTIEGTVKTTGVDASGMVTAVSVSSDEGEYDVTLDEQGKELLKAVGKKIRAKGMVVEKEGKKVIMITEFEEVP
ncbi:MAG: hypothetical protein OEM19_03720 [Deltaproteobacteria bacterium]|nr:hypothetical protein [Deltaproteobacteria bacterium]